MTAIARSLVICFSTCMFACFQTCACVCVCVCVRVCVHIPVCVQALLPHCSVEEASSMMWALAKLRVALPT